MFAIRSSARSGPVVLLAVAALALTSCASAITAGEDPSPSPSALVDEDPASPQPSPSPSPSRWEGPVKTYVDEEHGFALDYPASFLTEQAVDPLPGYVRQVRFVDGRFQGGEYAASAREPDGQIELNIYVMDGETLLAWVDMHSGSDAESTRGSASRTYFVDATAAEAGPMVAQQPSVVFSWIPPAGRQTEVVAILKSSRVVALSWSAIPAYRGELGGIFRTMVDTLRDA